MECGFVKKIFKKGNIFSFIFGALVFSTITFVYAYSLFADSVGFTPRDSSWKVDNVSSALNDLYSKIIIDPSKLKLIRRTNTINTKIGKKYIIFISVTSYTSQSYKPSIVSGCTIDATIGQIGNTYNDLTAYANVYLVTATSNTITIKGNLADSGWNFIGYYEF